MRTLTPSEAKAFYDRFGAKQDSQAFYEDAAVEELIGHADLGRAESVLELGCGTGRLAARLLAEEIPATARYVGIDVSTTMLRLASERLRRFADRAEVRESDGSVRLPFGDGTFDRVVATYVTDLLSESDVRTFLDDARRVLRPGGRLGIVGLTRGRGVVGRLVSLLWSVVHGIRPAWVGGCRPMIVKPLVEDSGLEVVHRSVVTSWGITSEIVVGTKP